MSGGAPACYSINADSRVMLWMLAQAELQHQTLVIIVSGFGGSGLPLLDEMFYAWTPAAGSAPACYTVAADGRLMLWTLAKAEVRDQGVWTQGQVWQVDFIVGCDVTQLE